MRAVIVHHEPLAARESYALVAGLVDGVAGRLGVPVSSMPLGLFLSRRPPGPGVCVAALLVLRGRHYREVYGHTRRGGGLFVGKPPLGLLAGIVAGWARGRGCDCLALAAPKRRGAGGEDAERIRDLHVLAVLAGERLGIPVYPFLGSCGSAEACGGCCFELNMFPTGGNPGVLETGFGLILGWLAESLEGYCLGPR